MDLSLYILNRVGGLDVQSDGLSSQCLDEDLHATAQTEDKMKSGLFLDVVVGESASVLKLLSSEDESLLIRRNSFFVLDLGLHVLNGVRGLYVQSDSLASQCLDEDLHATT